MRSIRFCAAFFVGLVVWATADVPEVIAQEQMGENACGPCAFVNSLLQARDTASLGYLTGNHPLEKARNFAERFGGTPSIVYGKHRTCYSDADGTADLDLLDMINRMRKEQHLDSLRGEHLIRRDGESPEDFISRVHQMVQGSIDGGFVPLLSVKSLKAHEKEWQAITGHWISVGGVVSTGTAEPVRWVRLVDPGLGKVASGMLYQDKRASKVPMTFTVNDAGKTNWDWQPSTNCLFVTIPSMALGTTQADWDERTFIAARYLIYRAPQSH